MLLTLLRNSVFDPIVKNHILWSTDYFYKQVYWNRATLIYLLNIYGLISMAVSMLQQS